MEASKEGTVMRKIDESIEELHGYSCRESPHVGCVKTCQMNLNYKLSDFYVG